MRLKILPVFLIIFFQVNAQVAPVINAAEVVRVEKILAADDMQGRKVYTPGIDKAASFIVQEFAKAGLQTLPGTTEFRQPFTIVDPESTIAEVVLDGISINKSDVIAYTAESDLIITQIDGYQKVFVNTLEDLNVAFFKYLDANQNVIVFVNPSLAKKFARLSVFHMPQFEGCGNRIFILTANSPSLFRIAVRQKLKTAKLTNVVGMLKGKSMPDEYVIFSSHYDHLGIGKPDAKGDSIYNGANDDASGTTAIITLAEYFGKLNNNARTLIFVAFTAEEIGEFGSAYFSRKFNSEKVIAMLNIEMIGTESKWGRNSAYITGFDQSDLGKILQKNLANTTFQFYPDPYPEQQLFLRSDNATLAKKGVPAHSISTSKMDNEPYYHQFSDSVETLDLNNMTEIIRAIGLSANSIIAGKDTPSRVKVNN